MISQKLKTIFLISIPVVIAHGIEELATGLYNVDSQVKLMLGFAQNMTPLQSAFWALQIMVWLTLLVSYFLILGPKWQFRLLIIPGVIMIYELEHVYKAIAAGGYYPGLVTALFFPVLAFFFWKEWLKNYADA